MEYNFSKKRRFLEISDEENEETDYEESKKIKKIIDQVGIIPKFIL